MSMRDKRGGKMAVADTNIVECPECGDDHVYPTADGKLFKCQGCGYYWEPKPPRQATSGQIYLRTLQKTFGIGERQVHRLRETLGGVNVELVTSDCVKVVVEPAGGRQRIPLPLGTESVDGQYLTQICCSGQFNHAFSNVPPQCSGKTASYVCHLAERRD